MEALGLPLSFLTDTCYWPLSGKYPLTTIEGAKGKLGLIFKWLVQ